MFAATEKTAKIIVYRSQADEAIDNWLWNGDGWLFIGCVFGSILVVSLLCFLLNLLFRKKNKYGY